MNWSKYKFSKQSEPELMQFFKVVANQTPDPVSPQVKQLWEEILPLDKEVLAKIASLKTVSADCIEIIDSDGEEDRSSGQIDHSSHDSPSNIVTSTEDFIDSVKELLEEEEVTSEDIIKKMSSCSPEQLDEIFTILSDDLNSESTWKLWRSISNSVCHERDLVASYFCKYILTRKMLTNDHTVEKLLQEMLATLPDIVSVSLVDSLVNTDGKTLSVLRKHVQMLSDARRNILLNQFLKTCATLQVEHFANISCLISKSIDLTSINIIMEMMYNNAKEFSDDKTFGKFIIDIIPLLGNRIVNYESHLTHIIGVHKSIYGSQANKVFENCLNEQKLNVSLSYAV
ncbi:hypothetical protein PPYR_02598 [Photinus pyralis]|uniref:Fanconi Anaemia group E protein C-terminal domain-containing protein n=1 Tax=Photinus pyralis TaxID=7054 RepID=A0A1Y1KIH7_PHOPY|nr:uncharacterized protein LOC116159774 [Photinus pyralis]XP_031328709.1 uncharacterized protein LOC116159774 [Photinus pyralis]XP_031328710.1 uncharacterized protein LOC116159774 [Photinus pyralis]XP_031328711.1 uncharacterized protein LOC116159774 [Photinus pyralis]XP_031328712.1 uncharacterized protein LOC116159774 [Photinus pyralis]KAB0805628.1 hypothetical protein PPYR_02598 [Photinus pyralis]